MQYFEVIVQKGKEKIYTIAESGEIKRNDSFKDILGREFNSFDIHMCYELKNVMLTYVLLDELQLTDNIFSINRLKTYIKDCIDANKDVAFLLSVLEENRNVDYFYKDEEGEWFLVRTVSQMIDVALKNKERKCS